MEPDFKHYSNTPLIHDQRLDIHILVGEFLGHKSPVSVYTPLIAADFYAEPSVSAAFPLNPKFEYGLLVLKGEVTANGERVTKEPLIVWWDFVARTNEEIIEAREDWVNGDQRFGEVAAYKGARMGAPKLSGRLKPS